jgi:hypothetical protein
MASLVIPYYSVYAIIFLPKGRRHTLLHSHHPPFPSPLVNIIQTGLWSFSSLVDIGMHTKGPLVQANVCPSHALVD